MPDVILSGKVHAGMVSGGGKRFTLTVRRDSLVVHCFKDHELFTDDIVRLEPDGPRWLSRGIRIVHTRRDVPRRLTFSCSGGLERIEAALAEAGFGAGFEAAKVAPNPSVVQPWHVVVALLVFFLVMPLVFGPHH